MPAPTSASRSRLIIMTSWSRWNDCTMETYRGITLEIQGYTSHNNVMQVTKQTRLNLADGDSRRKSLGVRRKRNSGFCEGTRDQLLVAQCDHGIDAKGAPRGDVTREHRDNHQNDGDRRERQRIHGADGKKQAGHQLREAERHNYADGNAADCYFRSLPKNHAQDILMLRA